MTPKQTAISEALQREARITPPWADALAKLVLRALDDYERRESTSGGTAGFCLDHARIEQEERRR